MSQKSASDLDLFTVNELATRWRIHPRTLREWIAAGRLPALKLAGGSLRVRATDAAEFIESRMAVSR